MATDVKFSQESIERQLHGNGGSRMKKKNKTEKLQKKFPLGL